jgi:hypothetical protein
VVLIAMATPITITITMEAYITVAQTVRRDLSAAARLVFSSPAGEFRLPFPARRPSRLAGLRPIILLSRAVFH